MFLSYIFQLVHVLSLKSVHRVNKTCSESLNKVVYYTRGQGDTFNKPEN